MRSSYNLRLYFGVFQQAMGNTVVNLAVKSTYLSRQLTNLMHNVFVLQ